MRRVSPRIAFAFVLAAAAVAGGAAAAIRPASPAAGGPVTHAKAVAIRIVFPSGRVVASTAVTKSGLRSAPSFSYPRDGSVILSGAIRASVATATVGRTGRSNASSVAGNISIFDGEITADSVSGAASAAAAASAGGNFAGTGVSNLQAYGRPHAFGRAGLEHWGYLTIAPHAVDRKADPQTKRFAGTVIGLDIHLTSAHGGLPAGTQIELGYSTVDVQTAPPPPKPVTPVELISGDRPQLLPPTTEPLIGVPQIIHPDLSAHAYLFPVFGPSRWRDTYGNETGDRPYQHGVDVIGSLGQPVVATTDGRLFSVGWTQ